MRSERCHSVRKWTGRGGPRQQVHALGPARSAALGDERDGELDGLGSSDAVALRERPPRLKVDCVVQRGVEESSPAPAGTPAGRQDRRRLDQVALDGCERGPDCVDELEVAEDIAPHRFGALVVGVQVIQCAFESLARVADHAPRPLVGQGMRGGEVRRARAEQIRLGGEVAIDGVALDACPLGDGAECRARRTDRSVQLDSGLGDPEPCGDHLGGALLELVLTLGFFFVGHHCAINIDRFRGLV